MLALGDSEVDVELLELVAVLCAHSDHAAAVPLLLGSAEALRSAAGIPRAPADEPRLSVGVEPARLALSPATWDERYGEGARLSAQEAWEQARQQLAAPAQGQHGAALRH
jgi:hypothetical protein